MTINMYLIGLLVFLKIWRFYNGAACLITERVVTHTDNLVIFAETLFYINVLTFVGFWHTGAAYGVPAVFIAMALATSLLIDAKNAFTQHTLDHKEIFERAELSGDAVWMAKRAIIAGDALLQIAFILLLWIGGLFSLT